MWSSPLDEYGSRCDSKGNTIYVCTQGAWLIPVNSDKLLRVRPNMVHNACQILNCEIVGESVTEHVGSHFQYAACVQHLHHGMGDGRQTVVNRVTVEAWIFIVEVFPASCSLCSFGNRKPGPHHCAVLGTELMTFCSVPRIPATESAASGRTHQATFLVDRPTPQKRTSGRSLSNCDDHARHVHVDGLRTPEVFAKGFHQVDVHRIHIAAKPSDEG